MAGRKGGTHKYPEIRAKPMSKAHIAKKLRDTIGPEIYMEWHLAIAHGFDPELEVVDGQLQITYDESSRGRLSTDTKTASMTWLAEMAYGKAPTSVIIENLLRVEADDQRALPAGRMSPAAIRMVREAFRLAAGPASPAPDAIDAEFTEVPGATSAQRAPASQASVDEEMSESGAPPAPGALEDLELAADE